MADAIEEIGAESSRTRSKALEEWAAMIYGDQNRQVAGVGAAEESAGSGGSSVPKDAVLLSQATMKGRADRLKAVKEANEAARLETQRLTDTAQVQGAKPTEQGQEPPKVVARQAVQQAAKVRETRENETRQTQQREEV
ncbi:MAG: hypothetical protein AB1758_38390, partial [Candidatus Eremiobacterota bacterium]